MSTPQCPNNEKRRRGKNFWWKRIMEIIDIPIKRVRFRDNLSIDFSINSKHLVVDVSIRQFCGNRCTTWGMLSHCECDCQAFFHISLRLGNFFCLRNTDKKTMFFDNIFLFINSKQIKLNRIRKPIDRRKIAKLLLAQLQPDVADAVRFCGKHTEHTAVELIISRHGREVRVGIGTGGRRASTLTDLRSYTGQRLRH